MSELNVIFQGFVINNQDPLMLGRIRAVPINQTESALLPQDWNPELMNIYIYFIIILVK